MYVLELKTWEVRLLRFEDVEYKDQPTIKIYDSKKESIKQILISQELYNEIIEYKNKMATTNKYHASTRDTPRDQIDYKHFMFCDSKVQLQKKINWKFKGVLKFLI